MDDSTDALAAEAARWVAESGLDYASAKSRAARALNLRRPQMPSDEQLEEALREHIALFCADTQPAELAALRALAQRWMERLAQHRPHLAGAVWRGTATRHSAVRIDLYADDPKALPIELLNAGVAFDVDGEDGGRHGSSVLTLYERVNGFEPPVPVHLFVHDADELRGALRPDSRGRSWRGPLTAVRELAGAAKAARKP